MSNKNDNHPKSKSKWLLGTGLIGLCALGFVTMANGQDPLRIDPKASTLVQKSSSSSSSSATASALTRPPEEEAAMKAKMDGQTAQSSSSTAPRPAILVKPIFTPLKTAPILEKREALSNGAINWESAKQNSEMNKQNGFKSKMLETRIDKTILDRTSVPVIMPVASSKIETAKARLISYGHSYALNMPQPKGMSVTIYGNNSFVKSDKGTVTGLIFKKVERVAESVQITRLEDGWTASFTRYGVVYSIDLLCDPESQCPDDFQIREIVADCSDVSMGKTAMVEAEKAAKPAPKDWLSGLNKSISKSTQSLFKGA